MLKLAQTKKESKKESKKWKQKKRGGIERRETK
jgi:hypothetical protein